MKFKTYILSFLVGLFIFSTLVDVSRVLVSYSIYYYEYNQEKEACFNEKPDMFQSGQLFLKALMKRVYDICPNTKPKPPKVESSNLVFFIQNARINSKDIESAKLKNSFSYKFSYNFLGFDDFFHPPIFIS